MLSEQKRPSVQDLKLLTSITGRNWMKLRYTPAADINLFAVIQAAREQGREEGRSESRERVDWQPIETAPKDGSPVDLWRNGERLIDFSWRSGPVSGWTKEHGYPRVTTILTAQPSHWMPALAPPQADRDGEGA